MSTSIVRVGRKGKGRGQASVTDAGLEELDSRVELIQALIPVGLEAVNELLQQEVTALAGERYRHGRGQAGCARWGRQAGSVYRADQKVSRSVPRVRDRNRGQEVPLTTYQDPRQPRRAEESAMRKVLKGLSCRNYEA